MANKYREYALQKDAEIGEIVLTYGVKFKDEEYKRYRHAQYRPYLILAKKESGNFLALKMSSQVKGYIAEYKIDLQKYEGENFILHKPTIADTRSLIEIEPSYIVRNGFVIDELDLKNLYTRIMKIYFVKKGKSESDQNKKLSQLTKEEAKMIYDEYIKYHEIKEGTVILTDYSEYFLYVVKIKEGIATCLPLYPSPTEKAKDKVSVLTYPSYIDYEDEYNFDTNDVCYISKYGTDYKTRNYISKHFYSKKQKTEAKLVKTNKNNQ